MFFFVFFEGGWKGGLFTPMTASNADNDICIVNAPTSTTATATTTSTRSPESAAAAAAAGRPVVGCASTVLLFCPPG